MSGVFVKVKKIKKYLVPIIIIIKILIIIEI